MIKAIETANINVFGRYATEEGAVVIRSERTEEAAVYNTILEYADKGIGVNDFAVTRLEADYGRAGCYSYFQVEVKLGGRIRWE